MAHWTQVLSNVSMGEFVLLAVLTTLQWVRHRIRGAGWVGALVRHPRRALARRSRSTPRSSRNQTGKALLALLLVVPYCLFRFAASFRRPSLLRARRWPSR